MLAKLANFRPLVALSAGLTVPVAGVALPWWPPPCRAASSIGAIRNRDLAARVTAG